MIEPELGTQQLVQGREKSLFVLQGIGLQPPPPPCSPRWAILPESRMSNVDKAPPRSGMPFSGAELAGIYQKPGSF